MTYSLDKLSKHNHQHSCTMEFLENGAACYTSLVRKRNFSVFLKHCVQTTFRTPEEENNSFRNVVSV